MQNQGVAVVGMNINKTIIQLDTDIKGEGINTIKTINVLYRRRGETVLLLGTQSSITFVQISGEMFTNFLQ